MCLDASQKLCNDYRSSDSSGDPTLSATGEAGSERQAARRALARERQRDIRRAREERGDSTSNY